MSSWNKLNEQAFIDYCQASFARMEYPTFGGFAELQGYSQAHAKRAFKVYSGRTSSDVLDELVCNHILANQHRTAMDVSGDLGCSVVTIHRKCKKLGISMYRSN